MMLNSGRWWLLVAAVAVLLMLFGAPKEVQSADEQVAAPEQTGQVASRPTFQLPKIFDFELYKRLFKKVYHGLEDTLRRKFMLARAFRAWISSLKYKYKKSRYYLALNHLSDRSPDELARMENHFAGGHKSHENVVEVTSSTDQIPQVDPNHIEENLMKLTRGQGDQSEGFQVLEDELRKQQQQLQVSRRKRDLDGEPKKSRQLDMNRLFSLDDGQTLDAETAQKVQWKPASNNPNYVAPEVTSFGLRDDTVDEMKWYEKKLPAELPRKHSFFSDNGAQLIGGETFHDANSHLEDELADEVFLDHRDSKCMFLPRDQGDCGSCYAFAITAVAEFLHCKQSGKLVAFSEQYLVDCGKATKLMSGCNGGNEYNAGDFVHKYGLELRVNYPYRRREDQCPYDENTDPKSMGYLRMDFGVGVDIPIGLVHKYLPLQPMYIVITTKNGFHEYGGGVMENPCPEVDYGGHAVVLVGHGREDGIEYWLIRNSYSAGWGERGHYKVAKAANCIRPPVGIMYGTMNGSKHLFKASWNPSNDPVNIKSHYAKNMRADIAAGLF